MAPEQWRDRRPPSEASDVYGLGGTLYFLLSGAPPHPARERGEDPPAAPLPADVPPRLREIVMHALAPDPADRPPSAGALAEELRRFRTYEPTFHDRRRVSRRALLFGRRHVRELVAGAAVLAVLLPLGIAGYRFFTGQLHDLARREATLRKQIDELEHARAQLEHDTVRLEGEAAAKQRELGRVEARLQALPKMDQALGAARAQAETATEEAKQRQATAREALERAAALEAALAAARDALAQAGDREAAAERDAGRLSGELAEVRARLAAAVQDADVARREGEEKRVALEAQLRERSAQLAAARAATVRPPADATGTAVAATPETHDTRRAAPQGGTAVRKPAGESAKDSKKPAEAVSAQPK
jgi:hypothetical protein